MEEFTLKNFEFIKINGNYYILLDSQVTFISEGVYNKIKDVEPENRRFELLYKFKIW